MPQPSPPSSRPPAPVHGSPITLLADPVVRGIVTSLGEPRATPTTAPALAEREFVGLAPRLVRDRLRVLERGGLVESVGQQRHGSAMRLEWALTTAGRDLYSLLSVMTRIVAHAARLPATTAPEPRDRLVGAVLSALADPVIVGLLSALTEAPTLDPVALEERCAPTPRRTLYRRLGTLVEGGAVIRSTTREVPRRSTYELNERWRPAVAILLLSSWWEWRHAGTGQAPSSSDLRGLVLAILPLVRIARSQDGTQIDWLLQSSDNSAGDSHTVRLRCVGSKVQLADDGGEPDAVVAGPPMAWAAALVNDRRDGLTFDGNTAAAGELLSAIRSTVLAYVR